MTHPEDPKDFEYRLPDCTGREDMEYYRDPAHRGYLSHTLAPGESPSLFFKPPRDDKEVKAKVDKAKQQAAVNRIW
jgi:large subunit ribosomal protein L15